MSWYCRREGTRCGERERKIGEEGGEEGGRTEGGREEGGRKGGNEERDKEYGD